MVQWKVARKSVDLTRNDSEQVMLKNEVPQVSHTTSVSGLAEKKFLDIRAYNFRKFSALMKSCRAQKNGPLEYFRNRARSGSLLNAVTL